MVVVEDGTVAAAAVVVATVVELQSEAGPLLLVLVEPQLEVVEVASHRAPSSLLETSRSIPLGRT